MKYIATREGVEVLTGKGPATEKQKEMVAKLLKDFPDVRDSFEYEDYKQAPTLHTASALISAALDSHMQNLQSENGYLRYIATRPGAEKHGTHGLFGREESADLGAAPDRVRDKFVLPLAELQAECLQKVVFVDFFQMDAVHIVPPVSAEDHRVWVSSCSVLLFLAYLLFFRIMNIPFPVDM